MRSKIQKRIQHGSPKKQGKQQRTVEMRKGDFCIALIYVRLATKPI